MFFYLVTSISFIDLVVSLLAAWNGTHRVIANKVRHDFIVLLLVGKAAVDGDDEQNFTVMPAADGQRCYGLIIECPGLTTYQEMSFKNDDAGLV